MTGPPVEIHLKDDASPKAVHKPAPVPVHWQDQVYKDLLRDKALGVVEKVPYGEPVTWCHRIWLLPGSTMVTLVGLWTYRHLINIVAGKPSPVNHHFI